MQTIAPLSHSALQKPEKSSLLTPYYICILQLQTHTELFKVIIPFPVEAPLFLKSFKKRSKARKTYLHFTKPGPYVHLK